MLLRNLIMAAKITASVEGEDSIHGGWGVTMEQVDIQLKGHGTGVLNLNTIRLSILVFHRRV